MPTYVHFPPEEPVDWPATPSGSIARALVERKEEILALQRKLDNPDLQRLCTESADRIMGKQNERTQREFHLFSRFCQAAKIPLYPITPIIIGLCKVAKDGAGAPPRSQLDRTLEKLADLEKNLFKNKPEYIKLCELGDELVGREDDDSSIATLDNTDNEEALSTDAQTDIDTDSSEGIFALSDSSSKDQASLKRFDGANSPQQQRVAKRNARLPQDGQVFGSRKGNSKSCEFAVQFDRRKDGTWIANAAESSFEHNHEPDPRRLADPAWLPEINKKNIRRALGLGVVEPSSSRKRSAKRSLPVDVDSDASSTDTSETNSAPVLSHRRRSSGQAAKRQAIAPPPQPAVTTGSINNAFLSPLHRPVLANSISVETIRAFLASAYPDLVPRAGAFFEAGITTFDQLVAFHCLSESVKAAFLKLV
ncbi:hypothetical protein JCM8115_003498 [Rhodotorula mucilaginosa]